MQRLLQGFIILAALGLLPATGQACSWITLFGPQESRVLVVGEVTDIVSEQIEGETVYGVAITPHYEFRHNPAAAKNEYRVYPRGVAADCGPIYQRSKEGLESQAKPGQLVTVIGYENDFPTPGNLTLGLTGGLSFIVGQCSAADIANAQYDYRRGSPPCGSFVFHGYKDISNLEHVGEPERIEILRRLSQLRHGFFDQFESLVKTHVSAPTEREALIQARYAEVIELGCTQEPERDRENDDDAAYEAYWILSNRWTEYCTQERKDAAQQGDPS